MHKWRQTDFISVCYRRMVIRTVPYLMFAEVARPPFNPWVSCCHGTGTDGSFANMCHSFWA